MSEPGRNWRPKKSTEQAGLDRLHCPRGDGHTVDMEWERVGGIRTGRMVPYCLTCKRFVPNGGRAA